MREERRELTEDIDDEGCEGYQDAGTREPQRGGLADSGVAGLDLVGLYIDDVVLLEIVIGGIDDLGIVEVDADDFLLTRGVLTDELDLVTHTIDSQVASLCQGFKDIDLLIADGEHTGFVDLTKHGNLVVGHADGDHGVLGGIEIREELIVNHLLTL